MAFRKYFLTAITVAAYFNMAMPTFASINIEQKTHDVARSVVIVDCTVANENFTHEISGQGIVVGKDGVILILSSLVPEVLPREWIKGIKVRVAEDHFSPTSAQLLGYTKDHLFAFVKTEKSINAAVFQMGETASSTIGDEVFSVGLLGKQLGYQPCIGVSHVRSVLDLAHSVVSVGNSDLTRGLSPVFDMSSGRFAGITLTGSQNGNEEQSSSFLPVAEISEQLEHVPTKPFQSTRAWTGIGEASGLPEDVRTLRKIRQTSGVMVGSVIADQPAEKGGLQPQDIILTVNSEEFSQSPVPELMVQHFTRTLEKFSVGDTVRLGVLRDDKVITVPIVLGSLPEPGAGKRHIFSPRIGITTRDLVFADAYARKLPQDTKGVLIALVKQGAPASFGSTPLQEGEIITKVNDSLIENEDQFLMAMKRIEQNNALGEAVFVVTQPNGSTGVCRIDLSK